MLRPICHTLQVTWAGAQPSRAAVLDPAWVQKLRAILDLCWRHNISVVLDMHQVGGASTHSMPYLAPHLGVYLRPAAST